MSLEDAQDHEMNMAPRPLVVRAHRVDIRHMMAETLRPFRADANDEGIALDLRFAANLPQEAVVDRGKITWATAMLVGNSMRYVARQRERSRGGSIVVAVGFDEAAQQLVVETVDNGPGLPSSVAEVLATEEDASILAPALQLLRDVLSALGGRVEVTTTREGDEHGTRLRLRVPAERRG